MNDATDMKLAAGVALACDRIYGYRPSIEKALPHNARDLIAFMDAHKVYIEFRPGGVVTYEDGAFRAYRGSGKELGDTEDGKPMGFSTLEDALRAYAEDTVLRACL